MKGPIISIWEVVASNPHLGVFWTTSLDLLCHQVHHGECSGKMQQHDMHAQPSRCESIHFLALLVNSWVSDFLCKVVQRDPINPSTFRVESIILKNYMFHQQVRFWLMHTIYSFFNEGAQSHPCAVTTGASTTAINTMWLCFSAAFYFTEFHILWWPRSTHSRATAPEHPRLKSAQEMGTWAELCECLDIRGKNLMQLGFFKQNESRQRCTLFSFTRVWAPIPGIPVAPKILHSRNHDLMRTIGFITMLAAATWMKWGGEIKSKHCTTWWDLCTEIRHIQLAWQDPEDFWFVLLHALAGYSYPRRKQRDAGKIQGVMSHGGRWSMPTFSFEDWCTCYLVCTKYDIIYIARLLIKLIVNEIPLDLFHLRLFYAVKRGVEILIEQPISSVPRFPYTRFFRNIINPK